MSLPGALSGAGYGILRLSCGRQRRKISCRRLTARARALQGHAASADNIEADLVDRHVPLEILTPGSRMTLERLIPPLPLFRILRQAKRQKPEIYEYRHHLEKLVEQQTAQLNTLNRAGKSRGYRSKFLEDILRKRIEWLSAVEPRTQSIGSLADLPKAFGELSVTIVQLLGGQKHGHRLVGFAAEIRLKPSVTCVVIATSNP